MAQGLRVRIIAAKGGEYDVLGTATEVDGGYVVAWDDGYMDAPGIRWHFEGDGMFNLEEVK